LQPNREIENTINAAIVSLFIFIGYFLHWMLKSVKLACFGTY